MSLGKRKAEDSLVETDGIDIDRLVDGAEEIEALTPSALKKLLTSFDKKLKKNQEMRIKFADTPAKFVDSEVDLDEEIKRLFVLGPATNLYLEPALQDAMPNLLGLLSHENSDIANSAVELFNEMTDPEVVEDMDVAGPFSESLIQNNLLELLVTNLERLDESSEDDANGVNTTLNVIENLTELRPQSVDEMTSRTRIMDWLLNRASKSFDANAQYATEVLSILLQTSRENRKKFGEANGVDKLLTALARFKKRDPEGADEEEFVNNIVDSLCSALLLPENQVLFVASEGLELMLILIKRANYVSPLAIKIIDFALNNNKSGCARFVAVLGLKTLFAVFMGKGLDMKEKRKKKEQNELEEHILAIIGSLFFHLEANDIQRVMNKFVENDFEKVDRLVELYLKYAKKMQLVERKFAAEHAEDSEERYLQRLDVGLFALQRICVVLSFLCGPIGVELKTIDRVKQLFGMQDVKTDYVERILNEYAETIGDAETTAEEDKAKIRALISNMQLT